MRTIEANKLISKLQFISIYKENTRVITFYIPKDSSITITNLEQFLVFNKSYPTIYKDMLIRDMSINKDSYSIHNYTDEESFDILKNNYESIYLTKEVRSLLNPILNNEGFEVYRTTHSPTLYLTPYNKTKEGTK